MLEVTGRAAQHSQDDRHADRPHRQAVIGYGYVGCLVWACFAFRRRWCFRLADLVEPVANQHDQQKPEEKDRVSREVVVVSQRGLFPAQDGHDADGYDSRHVPENRHGDGAEEENPLFPERPLEEIRPSRRQRHEREKRADSAARFGHIHVELRTGRRADEGGSGLLNLDADPVQDARRDEGGEDAEVDGEEVDKRGDGNGEQQVRGREEEEPGRPFSPQGEGDGPDQTDERDERDARLPPAISEKRQSQEEDGADQSQPRGVPLRVRPLVALLPDDKEGDERDDIPVRHILARIGEHDQHVIEHLPEEETGKEGEQRDDSPLHEIISRNLLQDTHSISTSCAPTGTVPDRAGSLSPGVY